MLNKVIKPCWSGKRGTNKISRVHFWSSSPGSDKFQVHDLNWASIIKLYLAELLQQLETVSTKHLAQCLEHNRYLINEKNNIMSSNGWQKYLPNYP